MLSAKAICNSHGQDSSYFLGWEEYEKNPYHHLNNPNGIIQMGLAENQLSFDLLESWLKNNPHSAGVEDHSIFKQLALFQDYHGLPAFKNALVEFMSEIRDNKVTFDPNNLVLTAGATSANETLMFCLANPGEAFLLPTPYYPGFDRDLKWRTGAEIVPIHCSSSNGFRITESALEDAYQQAQKQNLKVKGVLVTNPSNPLGTSLSLHELDLLIDFISSKNIHLISNKIQSKMASKNLYPQIDQSNPDSNPSFSSNPNHQSMYPSLQTKDLAENLFPDSGEHPPAVPFESSEEVVVKIPSAIVHLIDKQQSIELASGDLEIVRLRQSGNVVAVMARIGTLIQWPLAKDEAAVKVDGSHYFFTLRVPSRSGAGEDSGEDSGDGSDELINYGLTVSGSGSEELDRVLEEYSAFSVKEVETAAVAVVEGGSAEAKAAAFWTTLAPNVEDYSGSAARLIATGSGQLIKGILWCGDVTVERLKWGNEFLKRRMKSGGKMEVSPEALKRMKRVKKLTKMSENVATGLLSGVVKVSGFFTGSIVNSKPGKKFFKLLPGEIVLASLDGFNKVCDAVEVAGRNVMSTTSTVTTDLVSHKHGEDAAKVTSEGMHAAGHAIGTAWAVFKIRKALNPKSVVKPTTLVKAAASQSGSSKSKSKSS